MCDMDEERKEKKIVGFTLELSPACCWVMGSVYGIITSVVTSKETLPSVIMECDW